MPVDAKSPTPPSRAPAGNWKGKIEGVVTGVEPDEVRIVWLASGRVCGAVLPPPPADTLEVHPCLKGAGAPVSRAAGNAGRC